MIKLVNRGDIWLVDFSSNVGAEMMGTRPALIIQGDNLNSLTTYELTIVVPITSVIRNVKHQIIIEPSYENGLYKLSALKCEQLYTVDESRLIKRMGEVDQVIVDQVINYINDLIFSSNTG